MMHNQLEMLLSKSLNEERFRHSQGVMYTAAALAMKYDYPVEKAMIAGILHDCAKIYSIEEQLVLCEKYSIILSETEEMNPVLIHAKLGSHLLREEYHIHDEEISNAILYHTTGRPNMSKLEKIIYIADYIEPNRTLPNLTYFQALSFECMDRTIKELTKQSIEYLSKQNLIIDGLTIETYNYYNN